MRKLKLHHLFGGWDTYVLFVSFCTALFGFLSVLALPLPVAVLLGIAGALLPCVIVYLIQNCTPEVRKKIKYAREPQWSELNPEEYRLLLKMKVKKSPALKILLFAQIPIFVIVTLTNKRSEPLMYLIPELFAFAITVPHFIITWLIAGKWENVDSSARIAEIPIDSNYSLPLNREQTFYVYYLPSGRYVVDYDQLFSDRTVKVVKWGRSYCYLIDSSI